MNSAVPTGNAVSDLRPTPGLTVGRQSTIGWNVLLLVSFVAGTALRLWQLDIQIVIEDEWHAIHKLLHSGATDILTHLGHADYSIPLTLYYQWLYRHGGLSEWGMHLPSLVAGIALLLVGPRLVARQLLLPTRAIWLALMAISPLLVYHSKIARPYALTSLLTFVAIIAFRNWWWHRQPRTAIVYVVATFLGGWLHLITLTFTLLPFVYFSAKTVLRAMRGRQSDPRGDTAFHLTELRKLVILGIATALPLAVVLLPPLVVDWGQFMAKAGRDFVTPESVYRTLLIMAGTGTPVVAVSFWATVVLGFKRLRERDSDLAGYIATVGAIGMVVVAASGAEWISHPLVLARYSIPALPFVLLLVAEGLTAIVSVFQSHRVRAGVTGVFAAGLFAAGPIPAQWHYPNQFWGHMLYQFDYDPTHNPYVKLVPNGPIPVFYEELGKLPRGSITLIETPWRLESQFNAQPLYQAVHRQLIKIGLVTPVCGTYDFGEYPEDLIGMQMRELVHLSAVLRGDFHGADYLVVHQIPAYPGSPWPDMSKCLPTIVDKLGDPIYRDGQITVFRLSGLSPLGNIRGPVQQ